MLRSGKTNTDGLINRGAADAIGERNNNGVATATRSCIDLRTIVSEQAKSQLWFDR